MGWETSRSGGSETGIKRRVQVKDQARKERRDIGGDESKDADEGIERREDVKREQRKVKGEGLTADYKCKSPVLPAVQSRIKFQKRLSHEDSSRAKSDASVFIINGHIVQYCTHSLPYNVFLPLT